MKEVESLGQRLGKDRIGGQVLIESEVLFHQAPAQLSEATDGPQGFALTVQTGNAKEGLDVVLDALQGVTRSSGDLGGWETQEVHLENGSFVTDTAPLVGDVPSGNHLAALSLQLSDIPDDGAAVAA